MREDNDKIACRFNTEQNETSTNEEVTETKIHEECLYRTLYNWGDFQWQKSEEITQN